MFSTLRWFPLLMLAACTSVRHVGADRTEIEAVLRAYETHYNSGDAHALASLHTTDGRYATAKDPMPEGREAIAAHWSRSAGKGLALTLVDHETSADVGWALGTWRIPHPRGEADFTGRFVLCLRREEGAWRIAVDINNDARR